MNKKLIPLAAAAFLAMTGVHAAEPQVLIPPNRFGAAHARVPPAASPHRGSVTLETGEISNAGEFNAHVALWRSFDVPAAVNGTQPTNINDLGDIAGVYYDTNNNQHGFLRKADGQIMTFDAPNVGYPAQPPLGGFPGTIPTGINNKRDIVGYYTDADGGYHGFVRSAHGRFAIIDDPSSTSSPPATQPYALNDWGVIVGIWFDSSFNYHGFVRQVDGSFTAVDAPDSVVTGLYHINDLGEVGGETLDAATSHFRGLLLHPNGKLVKFEAPNGLATFGGLNQALNLKGGFTGTYLDANRGAHGYVRYSNGEFAEFTVPSAGTSGFNGTWSCSLNLLGTVVGYSYDGPGGATVDGYVRFADGTLILANAPEAGQQGTFPCAINDLNEFTGYWFDANGAQHGFVALAVP